jgi:hypothetical protein
MTFAQLQKLIRLARCTLLVADRNFVRKLEGMSDDTPLSPYENEKLAKLTLDYGKQIRRFERLES